MEKNYYCDKTFYFHSDLAKVVENNLRHEIEFMKKRNKSLANNKIKNNIEQLLSKYKA